MQQINIQDFHRPCANLELAVFNVGQGDHILFKFPNLEYGIIDFFFDVKINLPEPPVLTYFKALKRSLSEEEFKKLTISFLCISHTDKDHIRGVCEAIEWFDKNGVFIREFWLPAARDESQLMDFLKARIDKTLKKTNLAQRFECLTEFENYNDYLDSFFKSLNSWRTKQFSSHRYKNEYFGKGDHLVEIKSLMHPCSLPNCNAFNVGPFTSQLEHYYNSLTFEVVKRILNVQSDNSLVDNNNISHILRIIFGHKKLIFGGDTDNVTWLECLSKFLDPNFDHFNHFGELKSEFVKVSHHGSRASSDPTLWAALLPVDTTSHLAVSAGKNKKYNHPHAETLQDIRNASEKAEIFATNICSQCLLTNYTNLEYHSWYDDAIGHESPRTTLTNVSLPVVSDEIERALLSLVYQKEMGNVSNQVNLGLLAYIFEIPGESDQNITVRIALSKKARPQDCFYGGHATKLCQQCL